ncbi:MAG TPA: hypothetical protein VMK16_06100 [Acidimicrobiales bacterium]|nr:hypothetical protein [Acidimicrobiales bacterium]
MWVARAVWALLPLAVVAPLAVGLSDRSAAVAAAVAIALWGGWAIVLGAMFVPTAVTLTIVRVLAPVSIVAIVVLGPHAGWDIGDSIALASAIVATVLCFLPAVGAVFLHGLAYGDEERVALRAPGLLLLGPIELSWALMVASGAVGPLLLAARQWVAGAVLTAAGVVLIVALSRSLHALARRWLVFVPAGVVVHDPIGLADPVLLTRARVQSFGPAPAGSDATDLTVAAPGLAIEIALTARTEMVLRRGRSGAVPAVASAVLVTPTRPGVAVTIARERRVGQVGAVRGDRSP